MRVRVITTLTICFALFFPNTIYAANPKAGATCSKQGASQVFAGKKYTCIKSGKKLVWNKGLPTKVQTPSITSSPSATSASTDSKTNNVDWSKTYSTDDGYFHLFTNPCQREENISAQWVDLQNAYFKYSNCIWPINVAKYELGEQRPKTSFDNQKTLPADYCKISEPQNSRSLRGFYLNWPQERQNWVISHMMLGKKTNIQIIPIQTNDSAEPKNSPEQDYGRYTDFLIDWVKHSADNGASIQVNFPKKYIRFNGNIKDYGIFHEAGDSSPGHVRFNKDLVAQVDPFIDFTGINLAIIVTPAGTDMSLLQQGSIGELMTREGTVAVSTTEFPYTLDNFGSIRFKNLMLPYWWIHELLHSMAFDDHYGDTLQNINSDYGLGWWSLMTPGGGDLTAWEKWVMELISDSQVNCLTPNSTSVTWIAPSSVKTSQKKLSVVPISTYKAIVIESIRPSGLYYKLPKSSLGALVYEINLEIQTHGLGMKLILPANRDPNKGPFFLGEATLRTGESVVSNGHRITVLESGNFGDVVKVEKA
jgi:hypothetical protein